MVALSALWLPIVLSAVVVFFASYIIHTVLPWHRGDYPAVPREAEVMAALRPLAIPPGDYMVPRCNSMQEMRSPEFLEKMRQGPVMMMTVMPNGPAAWVRRLAQWFLYLLVVGLLLRVRGGPGVAGRCIVSDGLPHGARRGLPRLRRGVWRKARSGIGVVGAPRSAPPSTGWSTDC